MALSEIDRRLLQRCLAGEPRSWEEFVDRFMGLVLHVVDHTARARSQTLANEDREDLVSEVFLAIVVDDLPRTPQFPRGQQSGHISDGDCSSRRSAAVDETPTAQHPGTYSAGRCPPDRSEVRGVINGSDAEQRISDQEELERLLRRLNGPEADVVRMYHLEGKTYREISDEVGMPENTVGPTLSRARLKLRQTSADSTMT